MTRRARPFDYLIAGLVLAELREVPDKWRGHAKHFTLEARARLREAKR